MRFKVSKQEYLRAIGAKPADYRDTLPDDITLEGELVEEKITIVPSGRIDYCCECDAEHGYDCPKDKPAPQEKYIGCKFNCYHLATYTGCKCTCHSPTPKVKIVHIELKGVRENYDADLLDALDKKVYELIEAWNNKV